MPNKNYISGRSYEYKVKHDLEKEGYTVCRSAGSHGPWDLVAVNGKEVRLIQLKKCKKSYDFRGDMKELFEIEVPGCVKKEFWVNEKVRGVRIFTE